MNDNLLRGTLAAAACVLAGAAVVGAQKQPDLVIAALRATGAPTVSGGNFVVPLAVRVENRGTTPAGAFEIGFFKPSEKAAGLETQLPSAPKATVKGLAPGEGQDVGVQVTVAPASSGGKTVRLRARADTGKTVAESNEANNASPLLDVVLPITSIGAIGARAAAEGAGRAPGIPTVDLAISEDDVEIVPALPSVGSPQFTINARVHNLGTGSSGDFSMTVRLATAAGRTVLERRLARRAISGHGEQTVPLTVYTRATGAGDFLVSFNLVPGSPDANAGNNSASKRFYIGTPDVAVRAEEMSIDVLPDPRSPGFRVQWTAPIRNVGDAPAVDVVVYWMLFDASGRPLFSVTDHLPSWSIPSLPVGGFQLLSQELRPDHVGPLMLRIVVRAPGDSVAANDQADKAFVARP